MLWRLVKVAVEATVYFLIGIVVCLLHYHYLPHNTEFACRWTGGCSGWTKALVIRSAIGNLGYWWAYTAISTAILRLHPVVTDVRESRPTILLTWAFILTCGGVHLLMAYSNFNPIYIVETSYIDLTAPISCVAVFFIGAGLLRVRAQVEARRARERQRLEELESRL